MLSLAQPISFALVEAVGLATHDVRAYEHDRCTGTHGPRFRRMYELRSNTGVACVAFDDKALQHGSFFDKIRRYRNCCKTYNPRRNLRDEDRGSFVQGVQSRLDRRERRGIAKLLEERRQRSSIGRRRRSNRHHVVSGRQAERFPSSVRLPGMMG